MREWYGRKTPAERRAWIAGRDKAKVRERDSERSKSAGRTVRATENTARWRAQHPDRYAAHKAVARAVRQGLLIPGECEVCGAGRTHAHHDDYAKPLDVRWLCPLHHAAERWKE